MTTDLPPPAAPHADTPAATAELIHERTTALRREVGRAFIGQEEVFDQLLMALLAGGHVLIEGVPGLGKTLLVRALAAAMDCDFGRIQFTPDLMPADVTGHAVYDPGHQRFDMRQGPVFTHLLLADEINRAPAKTQAALLEAMQEGQATIEGQRFPLPHPFMVVATQNPIEQEGTYPLPEAQIDRFLVKILIDYPAEEEEVRMVGAILNGRIAADLDISAVERVTSRQELLAMQQGVAQTRMDSAVVDYAVRITRATRAWPAVIAGAGPRGGLALARLARAHAVMEGRDFVVPDDVRTVALPALRHRLTLAPEALIERQSPDDVLQALLHQVAAPRQ